MSTAIDNLRRLADRWRGRWHFDDDGVTLVVDDEYPTPIDDMDDAAKRELAELLNAIRPAVDEPRAEIARLTAELAEAREVPADVEARAWCVECDFDILDDGESGDRCDWLVFIYGEEDAREARDRAIDRLVDEGHAADAEAAEGMVRIVPLVPFRRAIAETRQPATVGGLLGSYPIVEWRLGEDWHQARIAQRGSGLIKGAEMRWRHHRASSWSSWGQPWGDPAPHMDEPARLVPGDQAELDPAGRGPLPKVTPRPAAEGDPVTAARCPICDRAIATAWHHSAREDGLSMDQIERRDGVCMMRGRGPCLSRAVDWRARALAAERERRRGLVPTRATTGGMAGHTLTVHAGDVWAWLVRRGLISIDLPHCPVCGYLTIYRAECECRRIDELEK